MSILSRLSIFATLFEPQDVILNLIGYFTVKPIWLSLDTMFEIVSTGIKLGLAYYGFKQFESGKNSYSAADKITFER